MSREEEIKAAIVVLPDEIMFASPEINHAAEKLAVSSGKLATWIETIEPIERYKAILVASAIIESLPALISDNPESLAEVKALIKDFAQ